MVGDGWVQRMDAINQQNGLGKSSRTPLERNVTLGGVGTGTQESTHSVSVPCEINGTKSDFVATILENSDIPAILGMESMQRKNAILDLVHNVMIVAEDPADVKIVVDGSAKIFQLQQAPGGYLMLPCSPGSKTLISPTVYNTKRNSTSRSSRGKRARTSNQ